MSEPNGTETDTSAGTTESVVDSRGVLKLLGVSGVVGAVCLSGVFDGYDDSEVPNWLEDAFSSRVEWAVDRSFHERPVVADGTIYVTGTSLFALDA